MRPLLARVSGGQIWLQEKDGPSLFEGSVPVIFISLHQTVRHICSSPHTVYPRIYCAKIGCCVIYFRGLFRLSRYSVSSGAATFSPENLFAQI